MQDRGADPDIQHSVRYGNSVNGSFGKNPVFFPTENQLFFCVEK